MPQSEMLQAEIDLVDALLRSEANHLQELSEKQRMIVDGVAELDAPSELWERYLEEIEGMLDLARRRVGELATLRDELKMQFEGVQ